MVVLVLPLFDSGICSRTPFFTHKTDQIKRSTTIPYPGLPPKQPCLPPIPKSYEANTLHWPITDRFEMQYSIYAIIHCQLNVVHVPSFIKLGQVLITSDTLPFGQTIRHKVKNVQRQAASLLFRRGHNHVTSQMISRFTDDNTVICLYVSVSQSLLVCGPFYEFNTACDSFMLYFLCE